MTVTGTSNVVSLPVSGTTPTTITIIVGGQPSAAPAPAGGGPVVAGAPVAASAPAAGAQPVAYAAAQPTAYAAAPAAATAYAAAAPTASVAAAQPTAYGGPAQTGDVNSQLITALQGLVSALSSLVSVLSARLVNQTAPASTATAQAGAANTAAGGGPAASGCCGGAEGAVSGSGALGAPPAVATGTSPGDDDKPADKAKPADKDKPADKAKSTDQTAIKVTAARNSVKGNAQLVGQIAQELGVDPVLAVATMLAESGGNERAVGDNGTSFGLFQLHKGGMLTTAKLTPEQAFDPETNARVAVKSLKYFGKKTGKTGGELAAASQRPANQPAYAKRVDSLMAKARTLLAP